MGKTLIAYYETLKQCWIHKTLIFTEGLKHSNPCSLPCSLGNPCKSLLEWTEWRQQLASNSGRMENRRRRREGKSIYFRPSRQTFSRFWSVVSCVRCVRCGCWVLGLDSRLGNLRFSPPTSDICCWYGSRVLIKKFLATQGRIFAIMRWESKKYYSFNLVYWILICITIGICANALYIWMMFKP